MITEREQHRMRYTRTYTSWLKMRARCNDPKNNRYDRYGGRGIKVCPEWDGSFEQFLFDMGERPKGMTLDRRESDKDYCKSNCRWATAKVQARHSEKLLTHCGKTQSITDWANELGIRQSTLSMRLTAYGWSVERALSTPKS